MSCNSGRGFRHQFYLNARSDLIEKRLLTNDWEGVAKVIALIAQAESDDYDAVHPPHNLYMQVSWWCLQCCQVVLYVLVICRLLRLLADVTLPNLVTYYNESLLNTKS